MFHCDKRSSDIVFGETTSRVAARWRFVIGRGAMRGVRFFRTPTPRGKGFFFLPSESHRIFHSWRRVDSDAAAETREGVALSEKDGPSAS